MKWKLSITAVIVLVVGIFLGARFSISGVNNGTITLSVMDAVFLVLAVISTTLGIVAIVFSWVFYDNSQKLNQKSGELLADITQKISKIDGIITQQYDKLLAKVISGKMGAEYEGTLPIEGIQLLRRTHKRSDKKS